MTALKVVLTVLHLVIAFGLIAVVLFQSSKSQGLSGSIAGGAETFFGKNKGKTMDGMLAKCTVVLAILFVVTSVSLSVLSKKTVNDDAETNQAVEAPSGDEEVSSEAEEIVSDDTEEESDDTADEAQE